jgi:hypothetical protein
MKNKLNFITKTVLVRTIAVLLLIGVMNTLGFSQTRVRFARGKSSATVSGKLNGGGSRSYVVGARARQMMTVRVRTGNVWLDIGGNDVQKGITIECRSTDDYIITVHNDYDYPTNFSIYIGIK